MSFASATTQIVAATDARGVGVEVEATRDAQHGDFASNLDWDAWLRLLQRGESFARTPEKLVGRRYNESMTTTALLRDGRRAAEDLRMFRRLWPTPVGETLALFYRAGY